MIKSVHIQNFRGLTDLRLEDCAQVNVLVGPNGVGKTTILEAIHLACSGNDPSAFQRPAYFRGQLIQPISRGKDLPLRSLFRDLRTSNEISIELDGPDTGHSLRISTVEPKQTVSLPSVDQSTDPGVLSDTHDIRALRFAYSHPTGPNAKKANHEALMFLEDNGIKVRSGMCKNCTRSSFIATRGVSALADVAQLISNLSKQRQRSRLVTLMQAVDDRVRDFEVLTDEGVPVPHVDLAGSRTLLPVHVMGDGFMRLLQMAAYLLNPSIAVIAVDEIDSGIHYSVMTSIWGQIVALLDQRPFQLFCTTHSEEMIEAAIPAFESRESMLRVFRLDRHGTSLTVKARNLAQVRELTQAGFELR